MEYINPLNSVSKAGKEKPTNEGLNSESAMMMDSAEICPKCKNQMTVVDLKPDEKAFWCEGGCRVSSPIPLDENKDAQV